MEDCVVQIQNKMLAVERQCSSDDCVNYYICSSLHAWIRRSYYLTIKLGFEMSVMSMEARKTHSDVLHTAIIGESYYHIGNYSDAQMWLKRSLQIANEALKDGYTLRLRYKRLRACFYLLMSGDSFNVLCCGYIIKDFTILLSDVTVKHLYAQYKIYTQQPRKKHPEGVIFSTDIDSFVGSQFNKHVHKFQSATEKNVSWTEKIVSQLLNHVLYCIYMFIWVLLFNTINNFMCFLHLHH